MEHSLSAQKVVWPVREGKISVWELETRGIGDHTSLAYTGRYGVVGGGGPVVDVGVAHPNIGVDRRWGATLD